MSLTFVAPPRLPEALAEPAASPMSLPHLEALLPAATIANGPDIERWLCDALGVVVDGDPPIAALRLAAEPDADVAAQARDGYWLCADPIATTTGLDSVRVDAAVDDLSTADARELIVALDEFFRGDGLHFIASSPSRWYVRAATPQQLSTTALDFVVGRSMLRWMPQGVDAATWRARLNETQMLLHAHPVNAARERRGLVPVSSCWVWGGGSWPQLRVAQIDAVVAAPAWVIAACRENGIAVEEVTLDEVVAMPGGDRRVVVFMAAAQDSAASDTSADAMSAAAQWRALDASLFDPLARIASRESITLIVPWTEGTLRIEIATPKPKRAWQRWFGSRNAPPKTVGEALRSWL